MEASVVSITRYISILFSLLWVDSHPSGSVITRQSKDQRYKPRCCKVTFKSLLSQSGSIEREGNECIQAEVFSGQRSCYPVSKFYIKQYRLHLTTQNEHFQGLLTSLTRIQRTLSIFKEEFHRQHQYHSWKGERYTKSLCCMFVSLPYELSLRNCRCLGGMAWFPLNYHY